MGQTAQELLSAGSSDVVVTADAIQVRDPDDVATDPREYSWTPAYRGAAVTLDEAAYKRQTALGSVADPDSVQAKHAMAGTRNEITGVVPPGAMPMMGPSAERIRAIQSSTAGFPAGPSPTERSAVELQKLSLDSLKHVAQAFGVVPSEDDTKESLAKKITGEDGVEPETVAAQRAARDASAEAARGEPTSTIVAGDKTPEGETDVGAGDVEADAESEEKVSTPRGRSR